MSAVVRKVVLMLIDDLGLDSGDAARVEDVMGFVERQIRRSPDFLAPAMRQGSWALVLSGGVKAWRASTVSAQRDFVRLFESLVLYRWFDGHG